MASAEDPLTIGVTGIEPAASSPPDWRSASDQHPENFKLVVNLDRRAA